MINQQDFFKKYKISQEEFDKTKLTWEELGKIYDDYKIIIPELESTAELIFKNLRKFPKVHSVKLRVKNSDHLIEKIIRKKIDNNDRVINLDNYKNEITDLIGLRVLHLFKEDWEIINNCIHKTWELNADNKPVVYYREGDNANNLNSFDPNNFEIKLHKSGYRSIHYIIETKPTKTTYFAEIQVRTIYEEAWSEIDHEIKYPYYSDNILINENLLILNRLSGSADEMGSHIIKLRDQFNEIHENHKIQIQKKDELIREKTQLIKDLEQQVNGSNLDKTSKDKFTVTLNKLNESIYNDISKLSVKSPLNELFDGLKGINIEDSIEWIYNKPNDHLYQGINIGGLSDTTLNKLSKTKNIEAIKKDKK